VSRGTKFSYNAKRIRPDLRIPLDIFLHNRYNKDIENRFNVSLHKHIHMGGALWEFI